MVVAGKSPVQSECSIQELEALMQEIMRAFYDLRAAGQRMGLFSDWGNGSWGVLQALAVEGPMTMSELARRRAVSRQYIQKIASVPISKRWIALEPNPADRRAPLMTVTADGTRRMQAHRVQLEQALRGMSRRFVAKDVAKAAVTVSLVRSMLDQFPSVEATDAAASAPRRRRRPRRTD